LRVIDPRAENTLLKSRHWRHGNGGRCREQITKQGALAVIPRKRNSLKGNADIDWSLYKYRHLVQNAFARLKQYRAVATRYDKLKRNYESIVAMACGYLWLSM